MLSSTSGVTGGHRKKFHCRFFSPCSLVRPSVFVRHWTPLAWSSAHTQISKTLMAGYNTSRSNRSAGNLTGVIFKFIFVCATCFRHTNVIEISKRPINDMHSINMDNGLVPFGWQALIWTNAGTLIVIRNNKFVTQILITKLTNEAIRNFNLEFKRVVDRWVSFTIKKSIKGAETTFMEYDGT